MADIYESFGVDIEEQQPLFVISVASEMVNIPIWTLRKLDELGVVCPERIGKKTRCYSMYQLKKLNYVCHLMTVKKVNISGIKFILDMEKENDEKDANDL